MKELSLIKGPDHQMPYHLHSGMISRNISSKKQPSALLARVLVEARKEKPSISMNKLLKPSNFELVVNATKNLAICKLLREAPLTMAYSKRVPVNDGIINQKIVI